MQKKSASYDNDKLCLYTVRNFRRVICFASHPPMAVQYTGHLIQTETRDNNTALLLVGVLVKLFYITS